MALPQSIDRLAELIKDTSKKISFIYTKHIHKKELKSAIEINQCAGQLGVCESEFKKTIRVQCKAVRDARKSGFNETVQKQIVIDSAVGYLLVREARFAVSTIRSYESMEIAYDLLESSALTIQGRKSSARDSLSKLMKKRAGYEYIYSESAYEEKLKRVQGFIEDLIETGDIDACINNEGINQNEREENKTAARSSSDEPIDIDANEDYLNDLERRQAEKTAERSQEEPTDEKFF